MRLIGLDVLRGIAIVLMVIFHFCFDLNNFHIVNFDLKHDLFWKYFRYLIVTIFVFSSGISLKLAHQKSVKLHKVKKRVFILGLASIAVSIGSYTQFPDSWIYFGILHFFLFASIVGLLFLNYPKTALFFGVGIIIGHSYNIINMHWFFVLVQKPLHLPATYTEDLATIFPWFGVFLLGMVTASYRLHEKLFSILYLNTENKLSLFFAFLGKHSLLIYLLHQPILFSVFLLL